MVHNDKLCEDFFTNNSILSFFFFIAVNTINFAITYPAYSKSHLKLFRSLGIVNNISRLITKNSCYALT